jgi:hypothetical protein
MSPAATEHPPDRRLIGFLAVSVLLHSLWLAIPLHTRTSLQISRQLAPLTAQLLQQPTPKSVVAVRLAERTAAPPSDVGTYHVAPAAPELAAQSPTISIDGALATARVYAREPVPRTSLDAPKPVLTVEAAVAKATEPDIAVESRGAAGEYVTTTRHWRCVTPLVVPLFMEGVTILAQCERRKG